MGRYILTKAIGQSDDEGEGDAEEITGLWRDLERTDADRYTVFNACRGFRNDALLYDYQVCK